jgi:signal transduction histidine kinase
MTWLRRWRRSRRDRLASLLVLAGLSTFVATVYVTVVLGGGALIGHTSSPSIGLSVLATVVVAFAFEPVQSRLDQLAARLVHVGRQSPYDVLRLFSKTVTAEFAAEELPARMAKILTEGTGAHWSQVWLVVHDQLTLTASWPPHAGTRADPPDSDAPGRRLSRQVRQLGELLGVLVVYVREHESLGPVEARLFTELANQAGLPLRGARLRAELVQRAAQLSARAEELRMSRERLVDAHDAERRRLERDIHDGAQQHLVALAVNLRLAQTLAQRSPGRAAEVLTEQDRAATETIQTLVDLSRGIYPRLLSEEGLPAALRTVMVTSPVPVQLTTHEVARYPANIEAAAYFCSLEALQNAAKHSGAQQVQVELRGEPDGLALIVEDDGLGFDSEVTTSGAGLTNMRDRIESAGGTLTVNSSNGVGTRVEAHIPAEQLPTELVH